MKIPTDSRRFEMLLALVTTLGVALPGAAATPTDGQPALKWTPHRAAATPADAPAGAEPQTTVAPPRLQSVPAAAATVQLPDGVPALGSPRQEPAPAAAAPARPTSAASMPARRPTFAPASPDTVFGIDIFRTPTRGATRPILADESPERIGGPAARGRVERLGGGLAPRFDGRRPERLATSIDALPSVMKQPTPVEASPPETVATPAPQAESREIIETMPGDVEFGGPEGAPLMGGPDGLMLGAYPTHLHVESFYDDPYACEEDDPLCHHSGRICAWLRRFGRPYYGWRWYRDFTASAGVMGFTNQSDLGFKGNFGFNEYLNQGVPFWNAFGVGWQVGVRGTQTNFQGSTLATPGGRLQTNGRDQVFVTTGFFTRAFEGRGLQGGAVYDYLHDNWLDDIDVAQLRYEVSYVWGYHEIGYWGTSNIGDQNSIFGPITKKPGVASTLDLYTAFYRLQFGDANEWKVWGGATSYGDGIIGSIVRAPLSRNWGLEGYFTYLIPSDSQTFAVDGQGTTNTFSPAAWNVGVNMIFYPGGRSRRSLASPYRPLFDVADNGTMIRRIGSAGP
ncbi:MAG: DUF6666 family protein [Planctomycetaceae bacterium]